MNGNRRTALVAGLFFLATEVTAIAALLLYRPVLHGHDYIVGSGADTRVLPGAFFEVILAVAVIGTAVTLFPIVKKQSEGVALAYVCGRLLEAVLIVVGIVSVITVVTLRQDLAGAAGTDTSPLVTVGRALVAIHDWTFLLGPNLVLGVNTLLLASLMHRSTLVPRLIPTLGLIGGPLIFASGTAVLFGAYDQTSVAGSLAAIPVLAWEVSLAICLIVKGFRASPIITADVEVDEGFAAPATAAASFA